MVPILVSFYFIPIYDILWNIYRHRLIVFFDPMDIFTERYVSQLEKQFLEQEQLISLLNQKIAGLESATDGGKSFAGAVKFGANAVFRVQWRRSVKD